MRALWVLVAAQVLGVANGNLIAVALPPLARELEASRVQQLWIVDAYVLVFAAMLIPAGVLGDRHGRRRAFLAGLTVFAIGSLGCALATSPGMLTAFRVVQGLGPALILPASLAIVMTSYPDARARARAVAVWGAGSGLGVAIGPVLGGIVVSALGWRWAFGIDVLAAAALVVASVRRVPRDVPARPQYAFDALGAVLAAAGMAGVVFVLIEGPQRGWASVPVLAAIAACVVVAVVFVRIERRHPSPLVDLALVRNRRFAGANVAAAALMFVLLASTVYVSQFLQSFRSLSALEAGLALLPVGAGTAVLASISGRLTASVAPRWQIQAGLLCAVAGTILLATVSAGSGPLALAPGLLLLGMGAGIALPATTATAVSSVTGARAGMASAIHNAGRQVGATLGVAVLGSIVLTYGANHTAGAYAHGLSVAMIAAAAALTGVAIIETRLLHPRHDARSKSAV